ncbi:hypothetical protein L596_001716 [Steinernema carpocapsae]|uniref:C2H2-type domain-containing protein n=1 Tax=Steinernema carpocapsae TaxID=34508 RepID=A0A4U8UMK4_STECR|nr:hypothetical protein L596_001716 [Steinernema carpocapsae]
MITCEICKAKVSQARLYEHAASHFNWPQNTKYVENLVKKVVHDLKVIADDTWEDVEPRQLPELECSLNCLICGKPVIRRNLQAHVNEHFEHTQVDDWYLDHLARHVIEDIHLATEKKISATEGRFDKTQQEPDVIATQGSQKKSITECATEVRQAPELPEKKFSASQGRCDQNQQEPNAIAAAHESQKKRNVSSTEGRCDFSKKLPRTDRPEESATDARKAPEIFPGSRVSATEGCHELPKKLPQNNCSEDATTEVGQASKLLEGAEPEPQRPAAVIGETDEDVFTVRCVMEGCTVENIYDNIRNHYKSCHNPITLMSDTHYEALIRAKEEHLIRKNSACLNGPDMIKCIRCGFYANAKFGRLAHAMTHSRLRVYCPYTGCPHKLPSKKALNSHVKASTIIKNRIKRDEFSTTRTPSSVLVFRKSGRASETPTSSWTPRVARW